MIKKTRENLFIRSFLSGAPADRLDAFRIVFPLAILVMYASLPWDVYADIPNCVWSPPGGASWLLREPLSLSMIVFFKSLFVISLITLAVGFLTRASALVAALSLFVLMGTSLSAYYYDRSGNQTLLALFVLGLSPTIGSRFSVDMLWRKRQFHSDDESVWPTRLIQFLFFVTFFAAGASKIINSGFDWLASENILQKWIWAGQTFRSNALFDFQHITHAFMIRQGDYAGVLGFMTLAIELSSAVFFLRQRWAIPGVMMIAALQLAIFLTMYISFNLFLPLYLVFLPIERIAKMQFWHFTKREITNEAT